MVPLARRNLLAEKARLALSVAGVAFAVLLILIIVSLYRGWGGASSLFRELPGDVWISQTGTADPFRSTSLLPAGYEDELASVPGVAYALPVYARRVALGRGDHRPSVFFFSIAAPESLPLPEDVRERFLPAPGRVALDAVLASDVGVEVGDTFTVLGHDLVVGGVRPGGNRLFSTAFLNAGDARRLLATGDNVSFYLLGLEDGADTESVLESAAATVPDAEGHTSAQFAGAMQDVVNQGFLPVVGVLVALGFVIGGAVIALTTYTATVEKARDFGVLKALGASSRFVYRIVIVQSLIVGVIGATVGVGVSVLAATLIKRGVPEFVTDLRWLDAVGVFAVAVAVSIVAAYVPVRRINTIDPAMVFRA